MRLLLVEPDPIMAQSLELMLRANGFTTYTTDLGDEAVDLGKLYSYEAIITELVLPDMAGHELIRRLRTAKVSTAIVVLSRIGAVDEKVRAFGFGADDYLTKPVHADELVARIHAVARRSHGIAEPMVEVGNLSVNLAQRQAFIGGNLLPIRLTEYKMLEALALNKDALVTKSMFMDHLYGGRDEPEAKIVDVFICKLRRRLREAGWVGGEIRTVWGRGYTLSPASLPALAEAA